MPFARQNPPLAHDTVNISYLFVPTSALLLEIIGLDPVPVQDEVGDHCGQQDPDRPFMDPLKGRIRNNSFAEQKSAAGLIDDQYGQNDVNDF